MSRPLRVLVVDDEPEVRETLLDVLGLLGHYATSVANGKEAVQAAGAAAFDVILLDNRMPGGFADEVVRKLRLHGCEAAIIIMTGDWTDSHVARALEAGAVMCLRKPFSLDAVEAALAALPEPGAAACA